MDIEPSVQATMDALRQLLRDASSIQASQYFNDAPVTLTESGQDRHLGQVLTRYITMVILSSDGFRIVFKVHFNPEQIRAYRLRQGDAAIDLTDKQLIDYMKELSNQMGGRVCRAFSAHGLSVGMSIPLCTRGIYEIYADYQAKYGPVIKFGDFWRIEGPFDFIYCSCYIELLSKDDLSSISVADESSQEGELDFL